MDTLDRRFFLVACVLGMSAVAAGAFGAHALEDRISPQRMATFQTAVRYQMFHVVGLLAAAWAASPRRPAGARAGRIAGWLFVAGIAVFCGSLYLLVLLDQPLLGAITPLGGLALIAGWIALLAAAPRHGPVGLR